MNKSFGPNDCETFRLGFKSYISKLYNMTLSFDEFVNPLFLDQSVPKSVLVIQQADEEIESEEEHNDYITLKSLGILKCRLQKY